ncbi:pre-peptidase C-terminal domain-containing protein [Nocardioides alpinus]|uniref:Pre-peptidase C-terminal domain-containing protein n=1 Tax=Nocardioides alpinus TaxID=748909 RepID=A0A1I0ZST0_9ACTN|nr:S8 family serine peptidase [Nocardioides alpinus]PKH41890.1 protease [Nocardioides alpinus]SFB27500.1 pre-peptidase C-terminal domain-containing protein [Nocardioides alpinus]
MSIHFTRRGAQRGLALLTAAAVVCGLAAGVQSANAAPSKSDQALTVAPAPKAANLSAGRYVVVLADPGAARYDGGVKGLRATAAANGKSFDAQSAKVADYSAYLTGRQNGIARSVGAEVMSRSTLSASTFTSRLSSKQATDLSQSRDVLMVVKDEAFSLDTYKSPEFLGLVGPNNTPGVWADKGGVATAGEGTVVGILDSGIWPESASFAGSKIDRNPTGPFGLYRKGNTIYMKKADGGTFRGVCQPGEKWNVDDCNSKIVGARYYADAFLDSVPPQERFGAEFISTRDGDGHGSHTASTAAGNYGVPASVEGRTFGNVSGMAPAAKIAAYKVCFSDLDPDTGGCYTSSTLSAVDDAIADGVDVINYSISGATDTVVDAVEYAFLGAADAGIFVAASAGNSGPTASTVAHNSPWLTTVAASTHVNYENTVVLGAPSNAKFKGASITDQTVPSTTIVNASASGVAGADATALDRCGPNVLDPAKAAGKIVVCTRGTYDRVAKSAEVKRAGGIAMVLANPDAGQSLDADFHSVPTIHVDKAAGDAIKAYAATAGATASFELTNTTGVETPLPQVAGFSSRGPAIANSSDVIKPDISAPGVSVLAAVAPPSGGGRNFDLYSGTSMSSPHVAGLAAFILGENPGWSPMAVKSAMMTTAYDLKKSDGTPDTNPFNQGAGHVDPEKFFRPGLVVESRKADWDRFIVGQGLPLPGVAPMAATDLNIPSMAKGQVTASIAISRTFTALEAGTWDVAAVVPGFDVVIDKPSITLAKGASETVKFTFTKNDSAVLGQFSSGFATLTGPTTLRLPVALRPVSVSAPAEVTASGAGGSADVAITAGFSGQLDVKPSGLALATSNAGNLAVGTVYDDAVTIEAGTKFARFDVDATNNGADLDLYVYRLNDAGVPVALAGQSATGSADERVTLTNPVAGKYLVEVDGYATATGESTIAYRYDRYLVTPATVLGGFKADPDPVTVVQGQPTTFKAVWSGLGAGRYLGAFEYDGALAPTFVTVTVP